MASYTVKKDESGIEIAKRYGISYDSLLAANPGVKSIQPGVTLRIPTAAPLGAVDPKSPWTPDLPQPDPKAPYIPQPRPKGPGDLTPIPPVVPPPLPPGPQPTYIPPAQSMAGLERSRVPQQPVVALTGAQPEARRPIPPGVGQGLIPGALRVAEAILPDQDILQRIFRTGENIYRRYASGEIPSRALENAAAYYERTMVPTETFRNYPGGISSIAELAANAPSMAMRAASSALAPPPDFEANPELRAVARDSWEGSVELAAEARAQGQQNGTQWVRYMMSDGNTRMFNWSWNEETTQEELLEQRAGHVGSSLRASDRPQIILESDRELLNLSTEDMQNMGYFWDEDKGHWVFGEIIQQPQTYGAASLPGWGYNYPSYRRGGGGGGGGGGGSYSYPSYLPKEGKPYPQSFVGREQPGGIPGLVQTRAARFGAITWRI